MNFRKLACSLILTAVSAPMFFGQSPTAKKPTDDPEALKKEAVSFLRETMADVNNLRTLENRISFSAELAGLMWYHDEKEARSLYVTAFGNFKELLAQYDQQMNAFGPAEEGDEETYNYRGGMFGDVTDKARLTRRFQTAMQVRQQIAMSLAEHDAELAFAFYAESLSVISNPVLRKQIEGRDDYFEAQLVTQIAQTNVAKATQFAKKAIEDGVNYQDIELLKKIYDKDPEKGADLAAAMLSEIKSAKPDSEHFWVVSSFLNTAGDSFETSKAAGGKKPMLSQSELRDLADFFGQALLDNDEYANGMQFISSIEKYSPSRAKQIRSKFRGMTNGVDTSGIAYNAAAAANTTVTAVNALPPGTSAAVNARVERERLERESREKTEKELSENVAKLADKQLPKEEREKIVTQVRRIIMQTPGKDKKIVALSGLATQVARLGDKELAAEIMKEAQALVNPQPKNYQDFLLTWMLVSGYAEAEPEKAFPLLEDTIMRANDTLAAFIKVGEFIDVAGEMIDDGEVQVGAFGGQMVRGLTGELGMADATLRTLARADFKKTRDLTSRFDRSEVRILAKMMILRAVLGDKKPAATPEDDPGFGNVLND